MELPKATEAARTLARGLYPHQVEGVAFLLGRERAILADDMGLGKTRQSIVALTAACPAGPYLIVCPASVKLNWQREIEMARPGSNTHVVGPAAPPDAGFTGWVIINYDLLKKHVDALRAFNFPGLVFDEAHYLKNHRAQRSRFSRQLLPDTGPAPVVHVLTGTPLTNRPRDLFALLQLVQHPLGRSFLAFAKRYCDGHKNDYGYWETGGASHIEELSVQLQGIMLRRRKSDVLDLPPKLRTWIDTDVPEDIRDEINSIAEHLLNEDTRTERGNRNIGLISRARRKLAVAKAPHTVEYVQGAIDQGAKVVLFSHSRHAIRRMAKAFADVAVTVTGEVPANKRQALVDQFQNDDSTRLFIGQIHAAGVGINLTAANLVVFNDLDWVPASHWQAEDRAHRIGQTDTVNVTYMVASGTLEEFVRSVLERKAMLIDDVVEGRAIADDADSDVMEELKRLLVHLTSAAERSGTTSPDEIRSLLRRATDSYLKQHEGEIAVAAAGRIKPVSETAIAALASVLVGPQRVVYNVASSSGGAAYHVEVEGSDVACDCKGFTYRGMCRHVRVLKEALATGAPVPSSYQRRE